MRISRDRAKDIAARLTVKGKQKVEASEKAYRDVVLQLYMDTVPAAVLEFIKKYPDYASTSSHITFDGHGFRRTSVTTDKPAVSNAPGFNNAVLKLTAKTADLIRKALNKCQDDKKAYEAIKDETKYALINLGTTKRIQESFPIASPFLGEGVAKYPVPATNLGPLKAKLEKLGK